MNFGAAAGVYCAGTGSLGTRGVEGARRPAQTTFDWRCRAPMALPER